MFAQSDDVLEVKIVPFSTTKSWIEVKKGNIEQSKYSKIKKTGHKNIKNTDHLKDIIVNNFDMECFLVGTLDDYLGRDRTDDMVDIYRQDDKPFALLVDTLLSNMYADLHIANNNAPKGLRLYSKKLSKTVNAYYSYESGKGLLKPERFLTKEQKLSFIAGAILRYGIITTDFSAVYCLMFTNSLSKAELCERFLNELNCSDVEYHIAHGHIPSGHMVYFKASPEIHEIIQKFEEQES